MSCGCCGSEKVRRKKVTYVTSAKYGSEEEFTVNVEICEVCGLDLIPDDSWSKGNRDASARSEKTAFKRNLRYLEIRGYSHMCIERVFGLGFDTIGKELKKKQVNAAIYALVAAARDRPDLLFEADSPKGFMRHKIRARRKKPR